MELHFVAVGVKIFIVIVWIMGALISDSDKMRIWEKYNREIKKLNK